MTKHLAEILPWDSRHFGCRVASVKVDRLNESTWRALDAWRRDNEIDCLYFRAAAADQATILQALRQGFDLVETRLTFQRNYKTAPPVLPAPEGFSLRIAKPADLEQLASITKGAFNLSRFYVDRHFDKEKVEQMYQIWIRKSVTGDFDDIVLVAETAPELLGYVTCRLNHQPGVGRIGLICVDAPAQGRGVGSALKEYSVWWFQQQGMRRSYAATQASNIGSQIINQRASFVSIDAMQIFHKWFD